jgi:hypothetical protein
MVVSSAVSTAYGWGASRGCRPRRPVIGPREESSAHSTDPPGVSAPGAGQLACTTRICTSSDSDPASMPRSSDGPG